MELLVEIWLLLCESENVGTSSPRCTKHSRRACAGRAQNKWTSKTICQIYTLSTRIEAFANITTQQRHKFRLSQFNTSLRK